METGRRKEYRKDEGIIKPSRRKGKKEYSKYHCFH
jgi:hypothetical protein